LSDRHSPALIMISASAGRVLLLVTISKGTDDADDGTTAERKPT
jgi:hypothetical protein